MSAAAENDCLQCTESSITYVQCENVVYVHTCSTVRATNSLSRCTKRYVCITFGLYLLDSALMDWVSEPLQTVRYLVHRTNSTISMRSTTNRTTSCVKHILMC